MQYAHIRYNTFCWLLIIDKNKQEQRYLYVSSTYVTSLVKKGPFRHNYTHSVALDQTVHMGSLIWELHYLLISKWDHILLNGGQCSCQMWLNRCSDWFTNYTVYRYVWRPIFLWVFSHITFDTLVSWSWPSDTSLTVYVLLTLSASVFTVRLQT